MCRRELLHHGSDLQRELRVATRAEMHAAAAALGRALKFDSPPFEWVYEGYKPLMLPDVVALRRGVPVALATLTVAVLRRLGLAVVPHFPHHGEPPPRLPPEYRMVCLIGLSWCSAMERPVCASITRRTGSCCCRASFKNLLLRVPCM